MQLFVLIVSIAALVGRQECATGSGQAATRTQVASSARQLYPIESFLSDRTKQLASRQQDSASQSSSADNERAPASSRQLYFAPAPPAPAPQLPAPQTQYGPGYAGTHSPQQYVESPQQANYQQQYYTQGNSYPTGGATYTKLAGPWSRYATPLINRPASINYAPIYKQPQPQQQAYKQPEVEFELRPKPREVLELAEPEVRVYANRAEGKQQARNPFKTIITFKVAKKTLQQLEREEIIQPEFYVQEGPTQPERKAGPEVRPKDKAEVDLDPVEPQHGPKSPSEFVGVDENEPEDRAPEDRAADRTSDEVNEGEGNDEDAEEQHVQEANEEVRNANEQVNERPESQHENEDAEEEPGRPEVESENEDEVREISIKEEEEEEGETRRSSEEQVHDEAHESEQLEHDEVEAGANWNAGEAEAEPVEPRVRVEQLRLKEDERGASAKVKGEEKKDKKSFDVMAQKVEKAGDSMEVGESQAVKVANSMGFKEARADDTHAHGAVGDFEQVKPDVAQSSPIGELSQKQVEGRQDPGNRGATLENDDQELVEAKVKRSADELPVVVTPTPRRFRWRQQRRRQFGGPRSGDLFGDHLDGEFARAAATMPRGGRRSSSSSRLTISEHGGSEVDGELISDKTSMTTSSSDY